MSPTEEDESKPLYSSLLWVPIPPPAPPSLQVKVDPEELIPKIPKPRDLQPYPTTESIVS